MHVSVRETKSLGSSFKSNNFLPQTLKYQTLNYTQTRFEAKVRSFYNFACDGGVIIIGELGDDAKKRVRLRSETPAEEMIRLPGLHSELKGL